jgi:hypothetical protein
VGAVKTADGGSDGQIALVADIKGGARRGNPEKDRAKGQGDGEEQGRATHRIPGLA